MFQKASSIALFAADKIEVPTQEIFEMALAMRKRVAFPEIYGERLLFRWVQRWSELKARKYGILEPSKGRIVESDDIDFMLVPGLAFDEKGNRLGRGKGFYDRVLSARKGRAKVNCAIAFSEQIVEEVTVEEHDQKIDLLISDESVIEIGR